MRRHRPTGAALAGQVVKAQRSVGFTLVELITVIALISILASIALPNFKVAIIQAKEATLREDLFRLRETIDQYYADKGVYPEALDSLVVDGYLRKVPVDPLTGSANWEVVQSEPDPGNPSDRPGIYDVRSASAETSLGGTPYNEW
jgi:general secretion pathway protein G